MGIDPNNLPPEFKRCIAQETRRNDQPNIAAGDTLMAVFGLKRVTVKETTDVDKLNKTERRFYEWVKHRDGFLWIGVQNVTLKLADDTRYTPDFIGVRPDGITAWEVKGFMRDDAHVKLKTAARQFPWIDFILVTATKVQKGNWELRDVKP